MKQIGKSRRGSALMITLPLVVGMFVLAMSLFTMSSSSSRITFKGAAKAQSDALAEAGLNAMYCQMTNVPANSSTINTSSISSTSLKGNAGGTTEKDGTYSASVVSSSNAMVNGQLTYTYTIQGVGTSPNGLTVSKARTTFTMTQNGMGGFSLGDGAIKANGNVALTGGSFTQDTTGQHGAGVSSNGAITVSGSKTYIDGAADYYLASSVNGKAYSTQQLSSPMSFPDATTTAEWRTTWLQQAQEATPTHPGGNIVNGNVSLTKNTTLTAPEYISGNLSVNGNSTVTLNPDPKAATPCVLFVHGTITINGGATFVNNGVLIVSDGDQAFNGTCNVYSAVNDVTCGLLSFSTDTINAVKITGNSGVAKVGIVYAINGGVTLSGGSVYQGSIISGGSVASGSSVTVSGGSSVRYSSGWDAQFAALAVSFTSSGLSHWMRIE